MSAASYGKIFLFAYAFGDRLVVHNNWVNDNENAGASHVLEKQFALEESLHGREILSVCSLNLDDGKKLIITGSEDTYVKASEFDAEAGTLKTIQTFSNHVASVRALCKVKIFDPKFPELK